MNILQVANPHVGAICLEHLLAVLPTESRIVGVVTPMGRRIRPLPWRRRMRRSWRKLRRRSPSDLVETVWSRLYKEHPVFNTRDVAEVAKAAGLKVYGPELLGDPSAFATMNIDLVVVTTFGERIPKLILSGTTHGVLNYHPSMLPEYRGGCPGYSAIRDGRTEAGVTIHFMEAKFDTGDIVKQQSMPLQPDETGWSYCNRAADLGKVLVAEAIAAVADGTIQRTPQQSSAATTCYKNYEIKRRIDWVQPATEIARQVRACHHLTTLGAYFYFRRRRIYPAAIQALPQGEVPRGAPGAVVGRTPSAVNFQCGDGLLSVSTLWLGAEEGSASELL